MDKLGLAIAGAGWIADFYYGAYQKLSDRFELLGCSGNPSESGQKRLGDKCRQWKTKAYSSFEEVLNDPDIACIGIMSPTSFHFEQTRKALNAGKHVLVEKPVSLDLKELEELETLSRRKGLVVFPGHNFVYRPVITEAKKIIDSGALGTISYASLRAVHFIPEDHATGWRKDQSLSGGGAMMDSGTHLVYQLLHLLGKPQWLSCFMGSYHYTGMDAEDTCQISLQYPDGPVAQVFQSWSAADASAGEIRIEGDQGSILIGGDGLRLDGELVETDAAYDQSFFHTLTAFHESALTGKPPVSDLRNAWETLNIIQSAYKGAESRTILELSL